MECRVFGVKELTWAIWVTEGTRGGNKSIYILLLPFSAGHPNLQERGLPAT